MTKDDVENRHTDQQDALLHSSGGGGGFFNPAAIQLAEKLDFSDPEAW